MVIKISNQQAYREMAEKNDIAIKDMWYDSDGQIWADVQDCKDRTVLVDGLKYQASFPLEEGDLVVVRGTSGKLKVGMFIMQVEYNPLITRRVVRKWE